MKAFFAILASLFFSFSAIANGNSGSVLTYDGNDKSGPAQSSDTASGGPGGNAYSSRGCSFAVYGNEISSAAFKLKGEQGRKIVVFTKTPLQTRLTYFDRRAAVQPAGTPHVVKEMLATDGVTAVSVEDAYTLRVYYGELFEQKVLMRNLAMELCNFS